MRQVAAELRHETAFARPLPDDDDADWALRWFTPAADRAVNPSSNYYGNAHKDRQTRLDPMHDGGSYSA